MGEIATRLYRRLPCSARSAAATAQGLRLRWWRYAGAEHLVEAALERDEWSSPRWADWQEERLGAQLERAARTVPWYRRHWEERRRAGDRTPVTELGAWPLVHKEDLRRHPDAFLADDAPRHRYTDRTSGTTGTPLRTVAGRGSLQRWFALHEARSRRWHGVSRHDHWAILGGQAVVPVDRDRPPFWVHNHALHQLYLSGQHVAPRHAAAFADALERHAPTHLVTYPALGAALAADLVAAGRRVVLRAGGGGPGVVLANAEPLTAGQRQVLAEGFGAPARETYGMAEMVGGASECEAGTLHWWPDAGVVEVVGDDDQPVPPGEAGRLVLTGLVGHEQVLVRYVVGDRGTGLGAAGCPCGRSLPVLGPVEGRDQDVLVLPGGRRLFWLNPVYADLPVVQGQVVQRATDELEVHVVPAPGWDEGVAATLADRVRQRAGADVRVVVELVDRLAVEPSGKVRPVRRAEDQPEG